MNQYVVSGNLAHTPELQEGKKKPYVSFMLINNQNYLDKETGAYETITNSIRCVSFGRTARQICKYLSKGSWCVLKGKLASSKWTDHELENIISKVLEPQDAKKVATRYTTELIVSEFELDSTVAKNVRLNLKEKENESIY